ncbi:MAG: hypothetical protein A2167_06755 [Planctomycetes bacterium RBG_13_46_10]|nr:MAG: hypothetical protein A2167_06755 [Planctomycetes bacterium RBG_13_46_10]
MNKQQKKLVVHTIMVAALTLTVVVGFANIKNVINRSESMRAMELLGKEILRHRKNYGSLPPEYYLKQFTDAIGAVRITNLHYRAAWIEFGAEPETTVLAHSQKNYRGFTKSGYVVLWLNGKVEWIGKKQFEQTLERQQKQQELQWIQEHLQKGKDSSVQY